MLVQIHTDKNIEGGSRFAEYFSGEGERQGSGSISVIFAGL